MNKKEAKQQVIRAGKELSETGLIARTWGNVSCRLDRESFAITASGRNYLTLTEEEVIEVSIKDLSYGGSIKPSSEKKIHRAVYSMMEDVGFVIHTHQDNASAVSAMGVDHVTFDKPYPGIGKTVFCADYGLPGTKKLCKNTVKALEISNGQAVILKHHGALCFGRDYEEAFQVARELEEACGQYLKKLDARIINGKRGDTKQQGPAVIWNRSQILLDFAEEALVMKPYLDDFAQIAGTKMRVLPKDQEAAERAVREGQSIIVKGIGAFCSADTLKNAEALSMITEKNAMAYFAARAAGGKPINALDRVLMRQIYLKKYSKLGA